MYCRQKINTFLEACSEMDMAKIVLGVMVNKLHAEYKNLLADLLFRYRSDDYECLLNVFTDNNVSMHVVARYLEDMGVDVKKERYIQVELFGTKYIMPNEDEYHQAWEAWCRTPGSPTIPPWLHYVSDVKAMANAIKGETK